MGPTGPTEAAKAAKATTTNPLRMTGSLGRAANATNATNGAKEADAEMDPEYAVAAMVARYGGETLTSLRRGAEMLEFIAACAKFRHNPWAAMADEWSRVVAQVVAQIEDTDLTGSTPIEQKQLTTEETLKCCIREHTTIVLHTQTRDGGKRDVEVEPYRLVTDPRRQEATLTCWNIDHAHIERIPLHRILYSKGVGIHFIQRFETFIEGEDEEVPADDVGGEGGEGGEGGDRE
jgi:hypothetical protein